MRTAVKRRLVTSAVAAAAAAKAVSLAYTGDMSQRSPRPLEYESTDHDSTSREFEHELTQAKAGVVAALIGMAIGLFFVILMVINDWS